jgi:hypothetical protein
MFRPCARGDKFVAARNRAVSSRAEIVTTVKHPFLPRRRRCRPKAPPPRSPYPSLRPPPIDALVVDSPVSCKRLKQVAAAIWPGGTIWDLSSPPSGAAAAAMMPSGAPSRSRGPCLNRALRSISKPGAGQAGGRNPTTVGHVELNQSPTGFCQDPSSTMHGFRYNPCSQFG